MASAVLTKLDAQRASGAPEDLPRTPFLMVRCEPQASLEPRRTGEQGALARCGEAPPTFGIRSTARGVTHD